MQGIEELKVGMRDGVLGTWKQLIPAYPQFHQDDKTTSLLWIEFREDFQDFTRIMRGMSRHMVIATACCHQKEFLYPMLILFPVSHGLRSKAFLSITME